MDHVIRGLQDLLAQDPEDPIARDLHARLLESRNSPGQHSQLWSIIRRAYNILEAKGLWEKNAETDGLLTQTQAESSAIPIETAPKSSTGPHLNSSSPQGGSTVVHPMSDVLVASPLLRPLSMTTWLPSELLQVLEQTYFLYVVATDAEKILPPGKSLLSVMSQPGTLTPHDDESALTTRVGDFVHKAFWDEASEALSSPMPSVQIPRLKRLYEDLHIVLASLLPHGHAVLVMLSSPLSPTSSPLRSAITHLREILASLKERCAPVRDPIIDAVLEKLEDPPMNELPRIVIETVRDTLKVAETMKEDLSQFVMGNMDEAQLHEIIRGLAQTREHELVISLWGSDEISGIWIKWMATLNETSSIVQLPPPPRRRWVLRLIQSLGQNVTVTCNILVTPSATEGSTRAVPLNELPPSLFLLSPTLLNIQNYLQASVIAATLRSLVRLPPHPQTSKPEMPSPAEDFMQRVWTFLSEEIDQGSGETKLINLADEIVRVRRHISPSTVQEDEEKRLREAVDRTLQPTDPVYQLLQRRLLQAVAERLVAPLSTVPPPAQTVPALHSGRGPRVGTRPLFGGGLLDIYARGPPPKQPEAPMVVKGFEDPVIAAAVTQVVRRLRECIDWAEEVWPEVIVAKE